MAVRLDPDVAREIMVAAGVEPLEPYPGSQAPWRCKCQKCGAYVAPRFSDVRQRNAGCVHCSRIARGLKRRSGVEADVTDTMRAAGLEPLEPYPGSHQPWPCRCTACGRTVTPRLDKIRIGRGGCKWCARIAIDPDDAAAAMRDAGLIPTAPYPGAMRPWPCKCMTCDKEVTPTLNRIRSGRGGCKWCGWKASAAAQRYDARFAAGVMFDAKLEPLDPYRSNGVPWRCRCLTCGVEVRPTRGKVQSTGRGCRFCTPGGGFDATKPAIVYMMVNEALGAVKVGISGSNAARIDQHKKLGWEPVATAEGPGELARECERAILRWWRDDLGLPPHLSKSVMPQGGWTETAQLAAVDIPETIRRIEHLATQIHQVPPHPAAA